MKSRTIRYVICIIVVTIGAVVGHEFLLVEKIIDDGLWKLSVTIRSVSDKPIKGVAADARVRPHDDDGYLTNPPHPMVFDGMYSAVQWPYTGKPLVVEVPTTETIYVRSMIRPRRFYQFHALLVVLEFADGMRTSRMVEIPDPRKSRHVTVGFP